MIKEIALILGAAQAPVTTRSDQTIDSAATLLTRMFARYASATSLSAHIRLTQTAMNKSVVFDSILSYSRPNKIFFEQKKVGDSKYSPELVSDGVMYYYGAPPNTDNHRVAGFREPVHTTQGDITLSEMWPNVLASLAGGDDSFVLEAMISRSITLRSIRGELSTFTNNGKVRIGNQLVNDIEGKWRAIGFGQEGTYSMFLTDEGDIVRHETRIRYAVSPRYFINNHLPANSFPDGVEVVSTWDVASEVGKPQDDQTFKLPKRAT